MLSRNKFFAVFLFLTVLSGCLSMPKYEPAPADIYFIDEVEMTQRNPAFTRVMTAELDSRALEDAKIQYLLEAVRRTKYDFIRNAAHHDGARAVLHLRQKYMARRHLVHTAREFIDLCASRSESSGKPYVVELPSEETYSTRDILYNELRRLEERLNSRLVSSENKESALSRLLPGK